MNWTALLLGLVILTTGLAAWNWRESLPPKLADQRFWIYGAIVWGALQVVFTAHDGWTADERKAEQAAHAAATASESAKVDAELDREGAALDMKRRRFEVAMPECYPSYHDDDSAFKLCMESRGVSEQDMEEVKDAFGK